VRTSGIENHSNDLPWRTNSNTIHIGLIPNRQLDVMDFKAKIEQHTNQIALVAITGASNVTGFINPIHHLAERSHAVRAQIIVDCAQLAPPRKIQMLPPDDPKQLDSIPYQDIRCMQPLEQLH